jgi:hypothetical protein
LQRIVHHGSNVCGTEEKPQASNEGSDTIMVDSKNTVVISVEKLRSIEARIDGLNAIVKTMMK